MFARRNHIHATLGFKREGASVSLYNGKQSLVMSLPRTMTRRKRLEGYRGGGSTQSCGAKREGGVRRVHCVWEAGGGGVQKKNAVSVNDTNRRIVHGKAKKCRFVVRMTDNLSTKPTVVDLNENVLGDCESAPHSMPSRPKRMAASMHCLG